MPVFDFSTFPVLETARLVLHDITPRDAVEFFALCSDPEVLKYDVDPPMRDTADALALIQIIQQDFAAKKSISWGIYFKEEDRLIGNVVFFFQDGAFYKADLGYRLAAGCWRQGIATESVRALMQFGFETMRLHRINVDTRMDNIASVRLMQKLGFQHEGVRRECILNDDGTYQSWGLFGMLEREYQSGSI